MKTLLQTITLCGACSLLAQRPAGGPPQGGPGGNFGPMQQETKLVSRFDKDGNKQLDTTERKAAREFIQSERAAGRGRRGPGAFNRRNEDQEPIQPGPKVSPSEVKFYPDAPLYASNVVRTFFLEFENTDWEKELADFNNTDVDVPAKLTVDGKTYRDIGVHFRGASSYFTVSEGRKRSLNLSLDFFHDKQALAGYRTLNLLNSHEDPTFLRSVLYSRLAREYIPAPQVNFVRVVINGESWGIYVNAEQFNKDFVKEQFGTTKGARWKVPGSPNGQGSLKYLGDDVSKYQRIYSIKSKDDPKAWADFIHLCKVLNETASEKLEAALRPLLDIDGALKFLALENALINNDGYWIRTSDYNIYQGTNGQFHILPHDMNETFSKPGGPGFGGGPGGFGPGMMIAAQMFSQGDKNSDRKLSREEFTALAGVWFEKLDKSKEGKLTREQFTDELGVVLPPPGGAPVGNTPARGGFQPAAMIGPGWFNAMDADKDGTLTRAEFTGSFANWFAKWDDTKAGALSEEKIRAGLAEVLPSPGGRGRGGRGPGGGVRVDGVKLDPLLAANDPEKPLISKLLAVPALRTRYLEYVHDIADKWLDWKKLGPIAEQYQSLIAADVRVDTRKLDSTEDFAKSLTEDILGKGFGPGGGGSIGLKNFADQRRKFLLDYPESMKPARP